MPKISTSTTVDQSSHDIRKTFATRLHNSGMPSRAISDLLGHSEISTTEQSYIVSTNAGIEQLRVSMSNALSIEVL